MLSNTISVVIPSYDRQWCIARAVNSVLEQTWSNLEVIVVDDGSQDGTRATVGAINDHRLRYVRHASRKGASAARNSGIASATGEFVAFLDSDDVWLPQKLERQMMAWGTVADNVGAICSGGIRRSRGRDQLVIPRLRGTRLSFVEIVNANAMAGTTLIARSHVLAKVGSFDESLPAVQDVDILFRIAGEFSLECVAEPLVVINAGHTWQRIGNCSESKIQALETLRSKYPEEFGTREGRCYVHLGLGLAWSSLGNGRRAIGEFAKSLLACPFKLGNWVRIGLGLLPRDLEEFLRAGFLGVVYQSMRRWAYRRGGPVSKRESSL